MSLTEQLGILEADRLPGSLVPDDGSLPQQIAAVIRHRIIHDEIKPGKPIRERQLAEELQVSRTPLRDALKILALEKLVEHIPNKGAVVIDHSPDDISDMLLVYIELDGLGGRLACRVGTEADFLRVERQIHRMESATRDNDRIAYFRANQAFHLAIVAASRSSCTIEFHANLNLRLHRVRYLSILKNHQWMDRSDDHSKLLSALRARDAAAYSEIQQRHFSVAWHLVDAWTNRAPEGE
ncbi:GntR family transcriptional regulator [Algicella marina]|uniref:FCD domain-containing protein n=1 Tax=Algicella marina TaxID=2683284 RepID=A0A6P1T296_9RHOB|nr:GntR family transcriptional regulator [Algicella marina]QHQ35429.1 FCD domain-containing protein [Algicella marina]